MTREFYYAPLLRIFQSRQKGWTRLLPRVTAAIVQLVKPITTSGQNSQAKLFQRFTPKDQGGSENPRQPPLPDNVVPLHSNGVEASNALAEKSDFASRAAQMGLSLPFLSVLFSLKDSHKLLLGFGRRLYARIRKDQDKSKLRKGVIIDHKA